MKIRGNKSAYPFIHQRPDGETIEYAYGLTIEQELAARFMAAEISLGAIGISDRIIAERAVDRANALINALNKDAK
jgi:hypothetical protein